MLKNDPITLWIDDLRNGDDEAATKLWQHFVSRIYVAARRKLKSETRPVYDEEDAAQSAFNSVFGGIMSGRFPDLHDRDSLWRLMLTITAFKVSHRHRYDEQQRRDVRRLSMDHLFIDSVCEGGSAQGALDILPSREPTAEFTAEFLETCENLFNGLNDPLLKQVVTFRMEGCTDEEIGKKMGCSRRTVQRRLEIIRRQLMNMEPSGE